MDLEEDYLDCPAAESYHPDTINFASLLSKCISYLLTVLGLLGNLTSISVLIFKFNKNKRRTFHNLLIILAICDTSFLLFQLWRVEFPMRGDQYNDWVLLFPYFIYPANSLSFKMSIFMTVAIAFERYLAVTHPSIHGKKLFSKSWTYVLSACLLSFLSASTKCLEADVHVHDFGGYSISPSELRRNSTYAIVTMTWETILSGILPFITLCYMNTCIYIYVRKTNRLMSQQGQVNKKSKDEVRLSVILVAVVAVFLVCHSARLTLNIHEIFVYHSYSHCIEANRTSFSLWAVLLLLVSRVLLVLNSAVNIAIYAGLSKEFKEALTCSWKQKRTLESNENNDSDSENGGIEMNSVSVRDTTVA